MTGQDPKESTVPEWMDTPEKRRQIWVWQALAAAYVGDKERAKEYMEHALRVDAKCAVPISQNDQADRLG